METGDKKWAIQQMLEGEIVLDEWDTKFKYHTGRFQYFCKDRNQWADVQINGVISDKYRIYKEEPLSIQSRALELFDSHEDGGIAFGFATRETIQLLAMELDRLDKELKLYKYKPLVGQMIEDGEL